MASGARDAVAGGAGAVHVHVYGAPDRESIDSDELAHAVNAVRAAVPNVPFGVSTGDWILRDAAKRHQKISESKVLPRFVSINFNEAGAVELATLVLDRGVGIEACIGSLEDAE